MNQRKSRGRIVMVSAAFVVSMAWLPVPPVEAAPTSCEGLASLVLPDATITAAQLVPAGAFTPPAAGRRGGGASRTCPHRKREALLKGEGHRRPGAEAAAQPCIRNCRPFVASRRR